jgi:hypothetical protein
VGQSFSYFVITKLSQEKVWELLTDVSNWSKFSDIYTGPIRWVGEPWVPGSILVGDLRYPLALDFEYLLKACEAPTVIRYLSQSVDSGFAIERTIRLVPVGTETMVWADAYAVGEPNAPIAGGSLGFLKTQSERWLHAFARFCDDHVPKAAGVNVGVYQSGPAGGDQESIPAA